MTDNTTSAEVKEMEKTKEYAIVGSKPMAYGLNDANYRVVEIEAGTDRVPGFAFKDNQCLQVVILPASIRLIGYGAFRNCTNLREVLVRGKDKNGRLADSYNPEDDNIEEIGSYAFEGCENLEAFEPQKVQKLHPFAFSKTGLRSDDIHLSEDAEVASFSFGLPWDAA